MTKTKAEFQRDKFLLKMLATIFIFQAGIFVYGLSLCMHVGGGLKSCPEIGRRYDQTFGVMVATTLALLTGAQMTKASTRRPSSGDPDDASASQPPLQPQQPFPRQSSALDQTLSSQEASASPRGSQPSSGKKNRQS